MFDYSTDLRDGAQREEAKEVGGHQVMSVSVPIGHASMFEFLPGTVMPVEVSSQGNAQETSKNFLSSCFRIDSVATCGEII